MSDDFFNSVPFSGQDSSNQRESVDSFAQAIAARFGSADLLTARLLPDDIRKDDHSDQQIPQHHYPPLPRPSLSLSLPTFPLMNPSHTNEPHDPCPHPEQHSSQPFSSISPSTLLPYLSDPSTLILDIRPHAAHASARISRALSLSVPSTLLKRPLFSLAKLAQMLPSSTARSRFSTWTEASRILVYDADSAHLPHNSNIAGLLRKFRTEGFTGELGWVRGGFQAVWREAREFTTTEQPSPEEEDTESGIATSTLRTKLLPKAAFSVSSTINVGPAIGATEVSRLSQTVSRAANPFFDAIRQNVELSQGITERIPLRLPRRVRRRIGDLPFQWLREFTRRSAIRHPSSSSRIPGSESESSDEPHSSDPDEHDPEVEEGTEALAMQFYRIELAEQRRLQTIMEHHSRESEMSATTKAYPRVGGGNTSTIPDDQDAGDITERTPVTKTTSHTLHSSFPFSITAGVEKGTKNRYNYIWPFEHARVRLHDGQHQGSHPGIQSKGKRAEKGSNRARDGTCQQSNSLLGIAGTPITINFQTDFFNPDTRMPVHLTPLQTPMDISPTGTQLPGEPLSPFEGAPPPKLAPRITFPSFPSRLHHSQSGPSMNAGTRICTPHPTATTFSGNNIGHATNVDLQHANVLPGVQHVSSPLDDYVNASYVQPLGTRKKYIATQGPLPSTFVDFWTLVWEQNVHVIVMLTREVENSMVKCGTYWADSSYGPFRLELLSTSPPLTPSTTSNSTDTNRGGFFFALREPHARNKSAPTTITRRFALSHTSYPGVPPRCIVHLQYLDWPDLNVPEDPRGVLDLIKCVERAVANSSPGPSPSENESLSPGGSISSGCTSPGTSGEDRNLVHSKHNYDWRHPELDQRTGVAAFTLGKPPPVLLHCSAGVGRTGGFIAVDAVLDGIRRELKETRIKGTFVHAGTNIRREDTENLPEAPTTSISISTPHPLSMARSPGSASGSSALSTEDSAVDATNFMSLMRPHLDSSATSLSNISANSLPSDKAVQGHTPIRELSASLGSSVNASGMDVDRPRAISVPGGDQHPLSGRIVEHTHHTHRAHCRPSLGSSLVASFSAPSLTTDAAFREVTSAGFQSSSNPSSDEFISSGPDFDSSTGTGFQSQIADGSVGNAEVEDPMETNAVAAPDNINRSSPAVGSPMDIPVSCDTGDKTDAPASHRIAGDSAGLSPGNPVIDYKLPRPLHTEASPPFLSSYGNPIWTVIQDMREQRMSLCQSLRQYVFVHAAVIEGTLQIVDEERERWGETTGSDEDPVFDFDISPSAGAKLYRDTLWDGNASGVRGPTTTHSSSADPSSPTKGKRGASPTELLKEDRTGALSLAKRPSIKRKSLSGEEASLTLEGEAGAELVEITSGTGAPSLSTTLGQDISL